MTFKYLVMTALPLTAGLFLLAPPIISLLFLGRGFDPAATGLEVLSLSLVLSFLNISSRYVLTALDRQRQYLHAIVAGVIANVALCAALIPHFGFLGACGAFLGAEATIWVMCRRALAVRPPLRELAREALIPLIAAVGMGLLVFAFRRVNVVALAALGCATYVALLFLLRAFSEEEMRMFRRVLASFPLPGAALLRRAEPRA